MYVDNIGEETLEITRAISVLQGKIRSAGLKLKESTDFSLFEDTVRATSDRYLMEDFSSRFFDLHGSGAFWIGAWDRDGEPVSVQAAKLEDLRDRTLGQHWQQQQRRIFVDPAPRAELGEDHAHDAFFMRGRIVYHGNLWLRKDARGQGLAEALTQLGFLISLLKWSPDYLYGLMAARNAMKGFGIRVGYRRFVPRGTHWISAPEHIRPDDWLVYSNRNDLNTLARTIAAEGPE
jgi:GNAT superfamily N-acetyltransferase